jgi:hypothetical protein
VLLRTNCGSASVGTPRFGKLAESPGTLHHRRPVMCRVGFARAFADVLNASNPIELGEQVLPACAAFVFDHALISTCKFARSTSRSTGTPQR